MAFCAFPNDIANEIELRFQFRAWVEQTLVPRHCNNEDRR